MQIYIYTCIHAYLYDLRKSREMTNQQQTQKHHDENTGTDDRNERTVMLSRIPKHIHEDYLQVLLLDAMGKKLSEQQGENANDSNVSVNREAYIEQVTLVYPTTSDDPIQNKNGDATRHDSSFQKTRAAAGSITDNKEHCRYEDRPYKKKKVNEVLPTTDHSLLPQAEHCGFGFVRFHRVEHATLALNIKSIRFDKKNANEQDIPLLQQDADDDGVGKGAMMKKKPKFHTIYIGPCGSTSSSDTTNTPTAPQVCFLWTEFRCPYGDHCKFHHTGAGGTTSTHPSRPSTLDRRKKIKCFNHRKGKCKLDATTCPYSHDFTVTMTATATTAATVAATDTCGPCHDDNENDDKTTNTNLTNIVKKRDDSEKDCFDYLHKNGKCRKLLRNLPCPYRHVNMKRPTTTTNNDNVTIRSNHKRQKKS